MTPQKLFYITRELTLGQLDVQAAEKIGADLVLRESVRALLS